MARIQTTARIEPLDADVRPDDAIDAITRVDRPFVLDSSATDSPWGRWTLLGHDPADVAEWPMDAGGDPFAGLAGELQQVRCEPASGSPDGPPLVAGWVGYFAYAAGRFIERIPVSPDDLGLPIARFALYDTVAAYDHHARRWWLAGIEWPRAAGYRRPSLTDRLARLRRILTDAPPADPPGASPLATPCSANLTRDRYLDMIHRAIEYIRAGDIFQVNLAQRFSLPMAEPPATLLRRLRRDNPSAFASLIAWDRFAVVSASPELFLDLRGRQVLTRPIKGTRPRTGDAEQDARFRRELLASPKDHAELAMIVDLERNDLGRVCEYGSVRVREPYALETHPTVYHLVATVAGRLRPKHDAISLLRASFPGGSITGAPKVRAMEIIAELEPVGRSVYCGSIGYLGLDGSACFNIAIRTVLVAAGRAFVYAGGGIVADSVPEDEYDETLAKAIALLRALGASPPAEARGPLRPQLAGAP